MDLVCQLHVNWKMSLQRLGNSDYHTGLSRMAELPFSEEVACGGYHTCVITNLKTSCTANVPMLACESGLLVFMGIGSGPTPVGSGELYTWGSNENGCLGIGFLVVGSIQLRFQTDISSHGAGEVLMEHFRWTGIPLVDSWFVSLGHGTDVDYIQPTMIDFGSNVKAMEVSCGFNHTGAIFEYT
ncbi:hypothetical protein Cgig2_024935 [Carnegiea gigantea]|uniref:Uncharacterized protein n=1 Tax=Carnegiea gigantea TaxID=171969 RepID=A0A9Q1KBU2_9CARY|nr:hypothetical protein Cgig2_024935 [Carnegiea gigantea]